MDFFFIAWNLLTFLLGKNFAPWEKPLKLSPPRFRSGVSDSPISEAFSTPLTGFAMCLWGDGYIGISWKSKPLKCSWEDYFPTGDAERSTGSPEKFGIYPLVICHMAMFFFNIQYAGYLQGICTCSCSLRKTAWNCRVIPWHFASSDRHWHWHSDIWRFPFRHDGVPHDLSSILGGFSMK